MKIEQTEEMFPGIYRTVQHSLAIDLLMATVCVRITRVPNFTLAYELIILRTIFLRKYFYIHGNPNHRVNH